MRFTQSGPKRQTGAYVAQVSYSEGGGFGALWDSERRQVPLFAPRGVDASPCEGDRLVMLPLEGGDLCAGVLSDTSGLAPGELRLRSAGGAELVLRSDGSISLNGLVVTPDGKLIEKES